LRVMKRFTKKPLDAHCNNTLGGLSFASLLEKHDVP
jgi:hypothetical protein